MRIATRFAAAAAFLGMSLAAAAQDKVSFGTNWVAQAEHGGYYQAVADGTYKNTTSRSASCPAGRRPTTACCCRSAASISTWAAT
jgi:hypothetical protein